MCGEQRPASSSRSTVQCACSSESVNIATADLQPTGNTREIQEYLREFKCSRSYKSSKDTTFKVEYRSGIYIFTSIGLQCASELSYSPLVAIRMVVNVLGQCEGR